jgi:hypothetical protein
LSKDFEELEKELKAQTVSIEKLEQERQQQIESNKKLEEKIAIKQRTVNLINDAPMNILKLKEEIKNHEKKMANLKSQWDEHKQPLEDQREELRQALVNRKKLMQQKLEETKLLRHEIEELNSDLASKDKEVKLLNVDLEKLSKESTKTTNRQFYTRFVSWFKLRLNLTKSFNILKSVSIKKRRILEIVASIDKQKKEIDKVLIETKSLQKEINQLSGKLERIFNANDELLFKDAKKDEANKKVYKLFIGINDNYEQLINTIEESSHIDREIRDLEDQITSESQNKVDENLSAALNDYKQIKEENEQLIAKIRSKK